MSATINATSHDADVWRARASALVFPTAGFVGGAPQNGFAAGQFVTVNPATACELARVQTTSAEGVDAAVRAARKAFPGWRATSPEQRKSKLLAVVDAIVEHRDELALLDSLEMGKPICFALGDVDMAVRFLRYYAEAADKASGEVAPTDSSTRLTLTVREPWGVVGAIVPWNFPVVNSCLAVAPALAAGNCIVVKPSEYAPSSAVRLAEIAYQAGLSEGVFNVVTGLGCETGAALARHMDVDKLHFTGSTATGRRIMSYAAESNAKAVMLETGGKSPQIVFRDACDIPGLAETLAIAAFFNSGQVCVSRTRLIVERSVADEVVSRTAQAAAKLRLGDPLDPQTFLGPLANHTQARRVDSYMAKLEGCSASVRYAQASPSHGGCFRAPALVSNLSPTHPVAQEEIFGPVLATFVFDQEQEAIELANATPYGLAATAWTKDIDRALRLARNLDAGRIEIRASAAPGSALESFSAEPFRGSGHGVLGGMRGLDAYVRFKAIEVIAG